MPYRCQICKDSSDIEDVYQSDRDYPSDVSDSDEEYYRRRWRRRHFRRTYQHQRESERTGRHYTRGSSEREQRRGTEANESGKNNSRTYRRRNDWTRKGRKIDNHDKFRSENENYGKEREMYVSDSDDANERDRRSESNNEGKENAKGIGQTCPISKNDNGIKRYTNDNESNKNIKSDSGSDKTSTENVVTGNNKKDNVNISPDKVQESNTDNKLHDKIKEFESNSQESDEKINQVKEEDNDQETQEESDYTTDSDSFWNGSSETETDTESDENYEEDRDAAQIPTRHKRYASYQSRSNRGGHRSGGAKSRKRRSISVSFVKMASGKRFPIITPKIKEFKCGTPTKRITLHRNGRTSGKEYKIVEKEVQDSIVYHQNCANGGGCFTKYEIVKIEKLINGCLWKRYRHLQQDIINEHGYANQRMLFHGSAKAEDIIRTGLDERYSDLDGMFGAGLYFAKHSSKSNQYAFGYMGGKGCPIHSDKNCHLCERKMLLCRVTLGRSKNLYTGQNLAHPPAQYNSVVGVPSKQKGGLRYPEYIVYRGEQVYPEYLITYKIKD